MSADFDFGVSLGISRVVIPCGREGIRVLYVDERTGRCVVPERIVLNRWKRKPPSRPGVTYRGVRLPPTTWRAVLACLAQGLDLATIGATSFARALEIVRTGQEEMRHVRTPSFEVLNVMLRYLERRRVLEPLLLRHLTGVDPRTPGVPDLFLYRQEPDGAVAGARFVEVKRPKERLRPSQREELAFLRRHGLRAGVVRLIERRT